MYEGLIPQQVDSHSSVESFRDLPPNEYYGLVTGAVNPNNIYWVESLLNPIELPQGVLIAVTGSDGKLEQHSRSKTEAIVIQESTDLAGETILQNFFGEERYTELFDTRPGGGIESKSFSQDAPFSFSNDDPKSLFPDITLNMVPVYPLTDESLSLYFRAREKTLLEMVSDKRIKKALKDQLRSYRRSIDTENYRNIPVFDSSKNIQYYNENWPAYSTGFKLPFLRTVQRKLDTLVLRLDAATDWRAVAREMPTDTIGRLTYFMNLGIITPEIAEETSEAYAWFLQQYHGIQETYEVCDGLAAATYDSELFEKYCHDVKRFANL